MSCPCIMKKDRTSDVMKTPSYIRFESSPPL